MQRSKLWLVPLTGVVFVGLLIAAFALLGDGQDATEKTAQEVVDYYTGTTMTSK